MKNYGQLLLLTLIMSFVVACGGSPAVQEDADAELPAPAVSTDVVEDSNVTTEEAEPVAAEEEPNSIGVIEGMVYSHLPTEVGVAAVSLYAVSATDNTYVSIDIAAAEGASTPFSLEVPAGEYFIYAYGIEDPTLNMAYFEDTFAPDTVTVTGGQTVPDLNVRKSASIMWECRYFDIPDAPDGRYAAEREMDPCPGPVGGDVPSGYITAEIQNQLPNAEDGTIVSIYFVSTEDPSIYYNIESQPITQDKNLFTLTLPVGNYWIYGYATEDPTLNFSHHNGLDGPMAINIKEEQSIININIRPIVDMWGCRYFDIPDSPDGRYIAEREMELCPRPADDATNTASSLSGVPVLTSGPGGIISGQVCAQAPPNPPYAVYVMDQSYGNWAFQLVNGNPEGCADFSISVPSGDYVVFAWPSNGSAMPASALTANQDGKQVLYEVPVTNEIGVQDLVLVPPGNGDCGTLYVAIPQTPDAKYPAEAGNCR